MNIVIIWSKIFVKYQYLRKRIQVEEGKQSNKAAIRDLVLTFCPTMRSVRQRTLKLMMPVFMIIIIMNYWNHKFRFNVELTRDIRDWFPLHFPENETGNKTQDVKALDPKSNTSLVKKIVLSRL